VISIILRFVLLLLVWWAALWFVLPQTWLSTPPVIVIALHLGLPIVMALAWYQGKASFKRTRSYLADRKKEKKKKKEQAEREAKRAEQEAIMQRRRAHLDCRAVWVASAKVPKWMKGASSFPCLVLKQNMKEAWDEEIGTALVNTMQQVFEAVFVQVEAASWLPVVLMQEGASPECLQWMEQAWRQAAECQRVEQIPSRPDYRFLSCTGNSSHRDVVNRALALFEQDSTLPALLLLGLDSSRVSSGDDSAEADIVVAALLLSRPGLPAPVKKALNDSNADPYSPYWERIQITVSGSEAWGNVPPPFQSGLHAIPPLATLHRVHTANAPPQGLALARQLKSLVGEALVDAALRPADENGEAKASAANKPPPPEPLELGWIAHNAGGSDNELGHKRITAISSALVEFEYESDMNSESGDLVEEYGDVGATRSALLLAEAVIRAAQLKKPVLIVDFGDTTEVSAGFVRPVAG
jgi:hypothetical protein